MKILEERYGDNGTEQDEGIFHMEADKLICDTLEMLGYVEGINIFKRNKKWYEWEIRISSTSSQVKNAVAANVSTDSRDKQAL